jgi:hypothetical protein
VVRFNVNKTLDTILKAFAYTNDGGIPIRNYVGNTADFAKICFCASGYFFRRIPWSFAFADRKG